MSKTTPFNEVYWDEFSKARAKSAISEINNYGDSLININQELYAKTIFNKYKLDPINIDFENVTKWIEEIKVPAQNFPRGYDVIARNSYTVEAGSYKIPYTDSSNIIKIRLNQPNLTVYDISYDNYNIYVSLTLFGKLSGNETALKRVKGEFEKLKETFITMQTNLNTSVEQYNLQLLPLIEQAIQNAVSNIKTRKESEDLL